MVYLVRHGQSERNVTRSGPFDCNLTELGFSQADRAGQWLKSKGIESIYCSPSIRTLQTATMISRHLGVRPKAWADIVEWGYLFDCPGLTGKVMRTDYPDIDVDTSFVDDVPWIAHKTDETWPELYQRAQGCVQYLQERHPVDGPPVLLVTHDHFARYFISAALGFPEVEGLGGVMKHYNCGISALEFKQDRRHIWYLNQHGHLEGAITD